jgi:hypothetical protein
METNECVANSSVATLYMELHASFADRNPINFDLNFRCDETWLYDALIEIIEMAVRDILDSIQNESWREVFCRCLALHEFLIHPANSSFDFVLDNSEQGHYLALLFGYSLMVVLVEIAADRDDTIKTSHDFVGDAYLKSVRDISVCLSSAMSEDHLWVLDEVLLLASTISRKLVESQGKGDSEASKFPANHYPEEFKSFLLGELRSDYVNTFCNSKPKKMGKGTRYDISQWSEKKLKFIREADREDRVTSDTLLTLALMNKMEFNAYTRSLEK